jgi:hypothetical protein
MTEQVTARTGRGLEPRTFRTDARSREGYTSARLARQTDAAASRPQPPSPDIVFRAVAECGQSTNVGFVQLLPTLLLSCTARVVIEVRRLWWPRPRYSGLISSRRWRVLNCRLRRFRQGRHQFDLFPFSVAVSHSSTCRTGMESLSLGFPGYTSTCQVWQLDNTIRRLLDARGRGVSTLLKDRAESCQHLFN